MVFYVVFKKNERNIFLKQTMCATSTSTNVFRLPEVFCLYFALQFRFCVPKNYKRRLNVFIQSKSIKSFVKSFEQLLSEADES